MKATQPVEEMTRNELLELVRAQHEAGIRINFSGKDVARGLARKVQPRASRRLAKYSAGGEEDQARNQAIEGENLQALVTLYRERGQIDLILTDPPYNTGNDFRYNDRWEEDPNDPDLGELVGEDDTARHTKWMRFMWPRLQLMKAMLKPGGVLAICIDHRELFRLGQMLDELFGDDNRIGIINWQKNYTPRNDNQHISTATEYVLVYARDIDRGETNLLPRTEAATARYTNPDRDPEGPWASNAPHAPSAHTHAGMVYAIQSPFSGRLYYPPERRCWAVERPTVKAWLEEWGTEYISKDLKDGRAKALLLKGSPDPRGLDDPLALNVVATARKRALKRLDDGPLPQLFFTKGGEGAPRRKTYLEKVRKGVIPMSYWADDDLEYPLDVGCTSWDHEESGHNQTGIHELDAVVGAGHGFQTVKPLKLFQKIIQLWSPLNGVVLDPFAGSGTTGHAVLALNAYTASTRRFILVEQGRPDRGDPYARSLVADRLRRVVEGDWENGQGTPLGGGFRFVQLQKRVDAGALLAMERDEMTDAVIASHFDANRRGGPGLILMTNEGYEFLVARNAANEGFYLVWDGSEEPPVFTADVYDIVVSEAAKAGLKPAYHVYARYNLFQSDDVRFYQIPDQILFDFGLSVNDAFNPDDVP